MGLCDQEPRCTPNCDWRSFPEGLAYRSNISTVTFGLQLIYGGRGHALAHYLVAWTLSPCVAVLLLSKSVPYRIVQLVDSFGLLDSS